MPNKNVEIKKSVQTKLSESSEWLYTAGVLKEYNNGVFTGRFMKDDTEFTPASLFTEEELKTAVTQVDSFDN